jgi:hypothetical protein
MPIATPVTSSTPHSFATSSFLRIARLASIAAVLAARCALAQSAPPPGTKQPPANLSLPHDRHDGMTVSADPYTDLSRAKSKFGKANPVPVGILPVDVFLHNETDQPIKIDLSTIQLSVHFPGGRQQAIDALGIVEVAGAVAHPGGPVAPSERRFPIGVGGGGDSKTDKMAEMLRPLSLDADIVPPNATIHGFLYFDVNHDMSLVKTASLYVPDAATVPANKPLMFFEVALGEQ